MSRLRVLFLFVVLLTTGCASTLYQWGSYEDVLYESLARSTTNPAHITRLRKELGRALDHGEFARVPPGKLAHLGYLYHQSGDSANAERCFQAEKAAFPESAQLMNHMIGKL